MSAGNNIERLVVRNAAGEAAPPYALAEISSAEDSGGESRLVIRKPTGSGQVVAVGPAGIAAGGIGYAFRGTPFVLVGASSVGTVCKATSGSWIATTGGAGSSVEVLGDARASGANTAARCLISSGEPGPPASDDTKVVRIKSDTGSPTIGDEAIATATLSGIGKVYKAVLLSWSGSAWTEGANIRVLVSPAKAGATPTANHNQVLLGQLVGTRTESSVDYALYGATEAGSGGGVVPCWVTSSCAKATRSGGTVTMNTVTVRLQKKGSTDAELINEASDATAYWDNINEPVTIGSGKSRQGAVTKLPSGIYLLLYVDCKDVSYVPT